MFVLIARAETGLDIPCMLFNSYEEGEAYLRESNMMPDSSKLIDSQRRVSASLSMDEGVADRFFTSYYDGCGDVSAFALKEIETQTPFVHFSLD